MGNRLAPPTETPTFDKLWECSEYELPASYGTVHMIICTLDYKRTDSPLHCSVDAGNMVRLAQASGIAHVHVMMNEECTLPNVRAKIAQVCMEVKPHDYFLFYYSGHAVSIDDKDGDEVDHKDEAFSLVDPTGQLADDHLLIDDEFARLVTANLHHSARVLVLADCCHSATIADFARSDWNGFEALGLSGCSDAQSSKCGVDGGVFTLSLLNAIQHMHELEVTDYSVGKLFSEMRRYKEHTFHWKHYRQTICLDSSCDFNPSRMAWPLVPKTSYTAPKASTACVENKPAPASSAVLPKEDSMPCFVKYLSDFVSASRSSWTSAVSLLPVVD